MTFKLSFPFWFTSNTTTSLITPTPLKLDENEIITHTHSANTTKKLAFFCNFSSIFTANHQFLLFSILLLTTLTPLGR